GENHALTHDHLTPAKLFETKKPVNATLAKPSQTQRNQLDPLLVPAEALRVAARGEGLVLRIRERALDRTLQPPHLRLQGRMARGREDGDQVGDQRVHPSRDLDAGGAELADLREGERDEGLPVRSRVDQARASVAVTREPGVEPAHADVAQEVV